MTSAKIEGFLFWAPTALAAHNPSLGRFPRSLPSLGVTARLCACKGGGKREGGAKGRRACPGPPGEYTPLPNAGPRVVKASDHHHAWDTPHDVANPRFYGDGREKSATLILVNFSSHFPEDTYVVCVEVISGQEMRSVYTMVRFFPLTSIKPETSLVEGG